MKTLEDDLMRVYEYMTQYGWKVKTILVPKGFGDAVKDATKAFNEYIKVIEVYRINRSKPRRTTYKTVKRDCAKRNRR